MDDLLDADGHTLSEPGSEEGPGSSTDETLAEAGPRAREQAPLATPERIGRHTVLRRLGAGGMGVVYEAHDEQIGRRVAIKLLRGRDGQTERTRLLREAQALAQLSHPNVVQVFEVGTLDERAYLVMELCEGTSLDRWLEAEPRSLRDLLGVFVQAGEGLAAAHAAGLVHRDFKPSNVLVGRDGRVRVVDFGLARASTGPLSQADALPASAASPPVWAEGLTQAGAMLGTPGYMSPEQLGSEPVTAASDQFSFCVALYQALYRQHPFAEDGQVHEILHNVLYGRVRPPPATRGVPPRLRAAVLRGLATDPRDRWPSMVELVRALRAVQTTRSTWMRRIATAAAVLLSTGGAWVLLEEADDERCTGAEAKLAQVWGPSQRAAVEQAFLGSPLPYAEQTWARVRPLLDGYGETWRSTHAQACEAGSRDARALDLRMACLERLRGALEAQVEILARADAGVVEQAVAAVTGLPPPRTCLRPDANEPASPDDPALASRHAALWSELSRVEALERSGKYHEALALAEQVLEHARALEHPSLEAPVLLALGEAHRKLGSFATAEQQLERAYFLGQELGRHEIVQKAAERLVVAVGVGQQDHERGLEWARHAEAALGRDADGLARAEFLASLGALRRERGEYAEALAAHEESLELYRAALAPDRLEIAHALSAIGIVLRKLGRNEEALTHHEQALTIFEAALGPEHPDIAAKLGNLATAQLRTGHAEQAASTMQRSLAIREAALGTDHTEIATTLTSLSVILSELGRHDEAEHAAQRALSILERTGTQPHTLCAALINLANARHLAGRYEPAMQIHRRAVVECEQAGLEDHLDFAQELFNFGQTLQELHALEEADAVLRRAVAILERSAQPVPERIMLVYNLLASVSLARGRFDEAIANAERWLALEPTVSPPPRHRVAMGWVLAQAQWGAGQRELALTHARDAARRAAALDDGPHAQQLRDDIRSWRAEHDPELGAPVAP